MLLKVNLKKIIILRRYYVNRAIIIMVIIIRGLYVHIPFCEKICSYCDFCKRVPKNEQMIWDYLKTLKAEYETLKERYQTIYIGGGTPSMLNVEQLKYLLAIFKDQKPLEYTIEINPESYTNQKGLIFKAYRVNRVSIGVQTFQEQLLKPLNRQHTNKDVFFAIEDLTEIGITNIGLDLMFSLPNQSLADLKADLAIVKKLNVKHLSYYSLILEEKTLLYQLYKKGLYKPNDSDFEALLYEQIIKNLKSFGYKQYEVSNFAKAPRYHSLHNLLYWSLLPYDAIGAGSFGFDGKYRYSHTNNVTKYIEEPKVTKTYQDDYTLYQDFLIFGLRKTAGISILETKRLFKRNPLNDFPTLYSFIDQGFLKYENDWLKVSQKGLFVLNQIVEVFI